MLGCLNNKQMLFPVGEILRRTADESRRNAEAFLTRAIVPMVLFSAILVGALTAQGPAGTAGRFPVLKGPYLGQKPPAKLPRWNHLCRTVRGVNMQLP